MRNTGLKFTFPLMSLSGFWYQLYWLYMIWEVFPPLFTERVCIKLCISFLNAWKNSQCGHLGLIFVCFRRKVLVYGFSFFNKYRVIHIFLFLLSHFGELYFLWTRSRSFLRLHFNFLERLFHMQFSTLSS